MITIIMLLLLLSCSVNNRRDCSIIYNRTTILGLIYCISQSFISFFILSKGIGLHGGLLFINNLAQMFHIVIFILTIIMLIPTSFYSELNNFNLISTQ